MKFSCNIRITVKIVLDETFFYVFFLQNSHFHTLTSESSRYILVHVIS